MNYQDPENFGVVMLEPGALGGQAKVTYAEFKNGEKRASRASGSDFSFVGWAVPINRQRPCQLGAR